LKEDEAVNYLLKSAPMMLVAVTVFGQPAIAGSGDCRGQEVSIDHLPQTQMAAAALLMSIFGNGHGNFVSVYGRFCPIDDKNVQLRRLLGTTDNALDVVDMKKIDDCNFEATTEWAGRQAVIARLNLAQLTSEYQQSSRQLSEITTYLTVVVTGIGGKPATCHRGWAKNELQVGGQEICDYGLVMTFNSTDPLLARAMRALAFLQQSCSPQQPRF
jgi:hypothetical protein